jgi:hypothetical protein
VELDSDTPCRQNYGRTLDSNIVFNDIKTKHPRAAPYIAALIQKVKEYGAAGTVYGITPVDSFTMLRVKVDYAIARIQVFLGLAVPFSIAAGGLHQRLQDIGKLLDFAEGLALTDMRVYEECLQILARLAEEIQV